MKERERRKTGIRRWGVLLLLIVCLSAAVPQRTQAATAEELTTLRFLTEHMDITPAAACGIMATIYDESRFIADLHSADGIYYGICQWSGARISRLYSFCAQNGLNAASLTGQLSYLIWETKTYFPGLYSYLQSLGNTETDASGAAYQWVAQYERPYNVSYFGSRRGRIAVSYLNSLRDEALCLSLKTTRKGVQLSWTGNSDGGYLIRRSESADGTYTEIASTGRNTDTYLDTSAVSGKTYYYQVSRTDASGNSLYSSASRSIYFLVRIKLKEKNCKVTLSRRYFTYTGKECKPAVRIRCAGKKLKLNRDYTVKYKNNVNAGRAKVTVKGMGQYTGSFSVNFRIHKARQKIRVRNIITNTRKGKILIRASAHGRIRMVSGDPSIVSVSGKYLKIKRSGTVTITLYAKPTRNYRAGVKRIRLNVIKK